MPNFSSLAVLWKLRDFWCQISNLKFQPNPSVLARSVVTRMCCMHADGAQILPTFHHKGVKGSPETIFGEKSDKNQEKWFFGWFRIKADWKAPKLREWRTKSCISATDGRILMIFSPFFQFFQMQKLQPPTTEIQPLLHCRKIEVVYFSPHILPIVYTQVWLQLISYPTWYVKSAWKTGSNQFIKFE